MKTINELTEDAIPSQIKEPRAKPTLEQLRIEEVITAARNLIVTLEKYHRDKSVFLTAKKQLDKACEGL